MPFFKSPVELGDIVSIFVYCQTDNSVLLMQENTRYWILSSKVGVEQSWYRIVAKETREILGATQDGEILQINKLWVPNHPTMFITHCIFLIKVDNALKNKTKYTLGKYRSKIKWVTEADLIKLYKTHCLKSPEIIDLFYLARPSVFDSPAATIVYSSPEDMTKKNNFIEICNDVLVTRSKQGNEFNELIEAAGIDEIAQELIYKEFLFLCFPAIYMGIQPFTKLVTDLGWAKNNAPYLFISADLNKRLALSFRELLYFLAVTDPNTSHAGTVAKLRCTYMFRYYDRDRDNLLNMEELKYLISDSRKSQNLSLDAKDISKEIREAYNAMGLNDGDKINESSFIKADYDFRIKGTSQIFRSTGGVVNYIRNLLQRDQPNSSLQLPGIIPGVPGNQCSKKNTSNYEIAIHTLKLQRSAQAINVDEIRKINEAISATSMMIPVNDQIKRTSMELFNQGSLCNELLKGVRYLTSINTDAMHNYTWGHLDPIIFAKNLIQVCNEVKEVFRCEPRLLKLRSPVYILGDLHGNISDLLCFEKILWHIGPGLSPCNLLFLGDYVDRGLFSLEVASYILAYKLQNPRKVNLVRGNHEIREVQKIFTFHKECILKLGDKLGNDTWLAINSAFDMMPLAATIDETIFCCHGGVPPPWLCPVISAINDIPVPLNRPEKQSSLAWELMWNDPVKPKMVNNNLTMELLANEGFAANATRGTAHVFSREALERFLKTNQLTHFVRAHEVVQAGFQVQQKAKLVTVFSSSKYSGGNNEAACILVDGNKLRILRLEID